ncbi:Signal transduction histidine kinase [Nocardioides exalbidus]|uniref:histidine kinase n=1 Tax=Nocardioides exalbidus TaxID=402596 RepID=A0A1H4NN69_9ACTN|nr:histidine kinase [Nocardioides exalbidus]SEB96677.1 Signal transduction histidine kinase [Nocardioides exalbidus]
MRRLLSGWDGLDPALRWLLRINLIALTSATILLAAAYLAGFKHTAVEIDLAVMVVSIVLMLVTPPLCTRYGAPAAIIGLTLSACLFAAGGTWATPNLAPLTVLLTMVPLLVGFPYLTRPWIRALMVVAVVGSAAVAGLGEWRRVDNLNELWWVNAIVIAVSLPPGVAVVVFLVRDAYTRLRDQSVQLAESRTRVVEVADAARRSIERDLHDGAQQRLLAMSVTIERARKELLAGRHESATALMGQLAATNREVLTELRELARGIYPPLLTERGLVAALQSTARRSTVPVTLDVADFERPSKQVEVAAYFCILEALTNAAKHSGATEVLISVRGLPHLSFVVSDDGKGFDRSLVDPGGLLGMEARAAAAGGTLRLETAPGWGTTLRGEFPPGPPPGQWTPEVNDR